MKKTKVAFIGPQIPNNYGINYVDFSFFNSDPKTYEWELLFLL